MIMSVIPSPSLQIVYPLFRAIRLFQKEPDNLYFARIPYLSANTAVIIICAMRRQQSAVMVIRCSESVSYYYLAVNLIFDVFNSINYHVLQY